MDRAKILVVDDEEVILKQLKWSLEKDYEVLLASNYETALSLLRKHHPPVVTLDIALSPFEGGDEEGMRLLDEIIEFDNRTKVIMLTANARKDLAFASLQQGAYDYYVKPINIEEIKVIISRALYLWQVEKENRDLRSAVGPDYSFGKIIGDSPEMQSIYETVNKVATTDVPVIIYGESGTGKELIANAIHHGSQRREFPFLPINCGAIPENLLESELFGYEKGAFTGAYKRKKGKFELANEGTIFLDEIGELPLALQVKLLRFLQEATIERVGGAEPIELDVRIIAATNRDLEEDMKNRRFRDDLFYRLSVVTISLPPLRKRGKDLVVLANHFLCQFAWEYNKKIKQFSKDAWAVIKSYSWPGNIRELQNKIKRAVIMANSPYVRATDLGFELEEADLKQLEKGMLTLKAAREHTDTEYIEAVLAMCSGNVSEAARLLDVSRVTLYDLMKKYEIQPPK